MLRTVEAVEDAVGINVLVTVGIVDERVVHYTRDKVTCCDRVTL